MDMRFQTLLFLLSALLVHSVQSSPVINKKMEVVNVQCPSGNPKLYSLPYALFSYIPSAQNFQNAKPCKFVDLNNDGFVDFACSFCQADALVECFTGTDQSCTYMNTKCGWILAEKYESGTDYCK